MSDGVSVLVTLSLVSAMLAAAMALAARAMGGAVHARSWCVAFLAASGAWGLNLAIAFVPAGRSVLIVVVSGLAMVVPLFLLRGFEQRAGTAFRHPGLLATGLCALLAILGAVHWDAAGLWAAISQFYRAAVLTIAIRAVVRPGHVARGDEKAMIALLAAFGAVSLVVGALAIARQFDISRPLGELDRWLLLLALPPIFTGIGLMALTLIATDVAARLRGLASTDPLTGALNRRGFEEACARAIASSSGDPRPAALVLADLDRFKQINDRYGHEAGDRVLRAFTECVASHLREGDQLGRTGGEEFTIFLSGATVDETCRTVANIRTAVAALRVEGLADQQVTASFGATSLHYDDGLAAALLRADAGLYRSKADGRDRLTYLDRVGNITPGEKAAATMSDQAQQDGASCDQQA